jgi:hypothetical protein
MDKFGLFKSEPTDEGATATSERRTESRPTADDVPGLRVKLSSGTDVKLIDVSQGGIRFECDRRLLPGTIVAVRLALIDGQMTIRGRVLRERVTRLENGEPGYEIAMAFTRPFTEFRVEDYAQERPEAAAWAPSAAAGREENVPSAEDAQPWPEQLPNDPAAEQVANGEDLPEILLFVGTLNRFRHDVWHVFNGNDW